MNIKLLNEHHLESLSLKGGCTGLLESVHVKVPHCWKSHVTAHLMFLWSKTLKKPFKVCVLLISKTYIIISMVQH